MIRTNCRSSFRAPDFEFLWKCLAPTPPAAETIHPSGIVQDTAAVDELLDQPEVYRALLASHESLQVSKEFYFYVITRHALMEAGLKDRELADYVAAVLADFAESRKLHQVQAGDTERFQYVFELLQALQSATGSRVFFLRVHTGNVSLFLSGIFPEHLMHRAERRGAPGLAYFESIGGSSFAHASEHQLARELQIESTLGLLGDRFHDVRQALNQLSDRVVSLDPYSAALQALLRGPSAG
ncbi:MAG: hypothetical protein JO317_06315 [Verrucomicrobiae bacterium]|nr:hypothetical protein [Verrucomicrobiae bacterium]